MASVRFYVFFGLFVALMALAMAAPNVEEEGMNAEDFDGKIQCVWQKPAFKIANILAAGS